MNICAQYLINNTDINLDELIDYTKIIHNKCFDNPIIAKYAYKYLTSNKELKLCNYEIITKLTQCFTIPQLYRIYKNNTNKYLFPSHYYSYVIDVIKKQHNFSKKLFSYKYYLKRMIYNTGSATYILDYGCDYIRETFESFNVNILKLTHHKGTESEFRWNGVRFAYKLLFANMSFKQIRKSIFVIMRNHISLNDIVKSINYDYGKKNIPNILFLKYISKYHSDILEDMFSEIAQRNVKVALFIEKYYPKLDIGLLIMDNIQFCEYLIRSKKDNKKTLTFNLIKKILEKFSSKNICKLIMHF